MTWRNYKCLLPSVLKRLHTSRFQLYILYLSRKGKTMETLKRSLVARSCRVGSDECTEHREFLGQLNYSVWYNNGRYMSLYICLNPQNVTPWVNPNVNYGLWVTVVCPSGFINYSKCTTLAGMLMIGEDIHVWGREYMGSTFFSILLWTWNFSKKIKSILKYLC